MMTLAMTPVVPSASWAEQTRLSTLARLLDLITFFEVTCADPVVI